jgi:carbon-monoxide dehydrogenase large subunit
MTHGRAQRQQVTIGGTRDGTILAYRLEIIQDCGAYPKAGAFLPSLTILMTPGPYNIPRAEAWSTSVVTSTTPVGAYRGAGRPEAAAAIDRAVDLFADAAGVDAAQVRRKNLLPKFTEPHTTAFGAKYDSGDYVTALERALEAAGYEGLLAEQAKRRANGAPLQLGVGLSSYVEITGPGGEAGGPNENGTVEVHPDGTVTVLTGISPHGQAHQTVWAMLVSEELGIPIEKITVKWGDTDLVPRGGGTGGSRSLQLGGAVVQQASRELLDVAASARRRRLRSRSLIWSSTWNPRHSRSRATRTSPCRSPRWPSRSGCSSTPCSPRPGRRSRSAPTWRSSKWTPRPARRTSAGS